MKFIDTEVPRDLKDRAVVRYISSILGTLLEQGKVTREDLMAACGALELDPESGAPIDSCWHIQYNLLTCIRIPKLLDNWEYYVE